MKFDVVVVGAGCIGLAVTREFSKHGLKVLLIEKNQSFCEETSSRNSEVIHSGIYYENDSLKAQHCVRGSKLLYSYLSERNIPYNKCGKIIVGHNDKDLELLNGLQDNARRNGVDAVKVLNRAQLLELEPNLKAKWGLFSKNSGVFDSHEFYKNIELDCLENEAQIAYCHQLKSAVRKGNNFYLKIADPRGNLFKVCSTLLVICSGLELNNIDGIVSEVLLKLNITHRYAKGHYAKTNGTPPFSRLIYPIPDDGGLGIHYTIDLTGHGRFGPDFCWIDRIDYTMNEFDQQKFQTKIAKYMPQIHMYKLFADYCGIRPRLFQGNIPITDFKVLTSEDHGVEKLIMFAGIESPGLTSCLSLASHVRHSA